MVPSRSDNLQATIATSRSRAWSEPPTPRKRSRHVTPTIMIMMIIITMVIITKIIIMIIIIDVIISLYISDMNNKDNDHNSNVSDKVLVVILVIISH